MWSYWVLIVWRLGTFFLKSIYNIYVVVGDTPYTVWYMYHQGYRFSPFLSHGLKKQLSSLRKLSFVKDICHLKWYVFFWGGRNKGYGFWWFLSPLRVGESPPQCDKTKNMFVIDQIGRVPSLDLVQGSFHQIQRGWSVNSKHPWTCSWLN